jgi:hypothetical protein
VVAAGKMNTPEQVKKLAPNQVFVFGSNLGGRHGKGAAHTAMKLFGARFGKGVGLMGQSYGIPTKDHQMKVLPLPRIRLFVESFLGFAESRPELEFLVTKIGCGLAGYDIASIAPMFSKVPTNVILPKEFEYYNFNRRHDI